MNSVKFRLSLTTEQRNYLMDEVDNNLKRAITAYEKYGVEMPVYILTNFIASIEKARELASLLGYRPIELLAKAHEIYNNVKDELVNKGYKQYLI